MKRTFARFHENKISGFSDIYFAKHRNGDYPLRFEMLHIRDVYLCGRRMLVGNGCRTSF
jgi:hypothetical protein